MVIHFMLTNNVIRATNTSVVFDGVNIVKLAVRKYKDHILNKPLSRVACKFRLPSRRASSLA